MKKRTALWIVVACIALGSGLWMLGESRQRGNDRRKRRFAEQLVLTGRPQEAIALIGNRRPWPAGSPQRRAWMQVAVEALQQVGDANRLGQIYYEDPSLLEDHEEASLLAARALILRNDMDNFERLRSQWRGREESRHAWLILEADSLLRRGRRAQALALLTENHLSDKWEASRHVRLALLQSSEPQEAWRHLAEAIRSDPDQAVARLFRAQLLEASGRIDEARLEYVAARLLQPHNAALCDQLAEFYRRRGAARQMLDTWQQADGAARADFIDLKAEFWSRVALPASAPFQPPAPGPLQGLVRLVRSLPEGRFWDEQRLPEFERAHHAARRRPEIRWLRTLELLRNGQQQAAVQLLREKGTVPWEDSLRRCLLMTINLRLYGELDPEAQLRTDSPVGGSGHPLLDQLNQLHAVQRQPSGALRVALTGPHGLPLVLMANGWLKAAVQLDDRSPLPPGSPDWAAYGMTQAHRLAASPGAGLRYARLQPPTSELKLLIGEMLLEQHSNDEAARQLAELTSIDGPVGQRANWLTLMLLVNQQQYEAALSHLNTHQQFAATQNGKEMRARIALLQHEPEVAQAIYEALRADSIEAQVFLARSAYHDGDLKEAERLTLQLLEQFPADQRLLASLLELRRQLADGTRPAAKPSADAEPGAAKAEVSLLPSAAGEAG